MNKQQPFPLAPPSMAADWSQLPKDLLQLISSKLDSDFYQLRLRSVCSSWHSSIPKIHLTLPSKFPIPSYNSQFVSLSKRSLFLIKPPQNQHNQTLTHPWLIKIGPDSCDQTHLWNPLSRDEQLTLDFPHVIDFNEHRVIDLGCEFVNGNFPYKSSQYSFSLSSLYKKMAVVYNDQSPVLLTIHLSGKLAIFRGGDEQWTIIPEMPMPFDDVCVFNGKPIAVDGSGRTVTVGMDLSLELVAEAVFSGGKKFLVESDGELLLVDKYVSYLHHGNLLDDNNVIVVDVDDDELHGFGMKRAVRFDVFRLDEREKKWVEVRNLGDRVLFLGEECAFSASASDLCIGNGNSVIFRDDVYHNLHVFHLNQHGISWLSDLAGSSKLFWPPPEWVGLRVDDNRVLILD